MDPGSIYLYNAVTPKERVLQTVAGPRRQWRVVYQHQVSYLETGRTYRAVTPSLLTSSKVFQVRSSQVSLVLPVLQSVPYGALVVL